MSIRVRVQKCKVAASKVHANLNPGVPGFDNGLGPVDDLELVEDIGDMIADTLQRDVQPVDDLLLVMTAGDRARG